MTKSLTSLWLKNIRRVSRVQQAQGQKFFKSLLTQAVRVPAAAVRRAKPTAALKAAKTVKASVSKKPQPRRQSSPSPVHRSETLPGRWLKSFFTLPGASPADDVLAVPAFGRSPDNAPAAGRHAARMPADCQ